MKSPDHQYHRQYQHQFQYRRHYHQRRKRRRNHPKRKRRNTHDHSKQKNMCQPKMKELYPKFMPTVLQLDKKRKSQKQKSYQMDPSSLLAAIVVATRWKRRSRLLLLMQTKPPTKSTRRSIHLMTMTTKHWNRRDPELPKNRRNEEGDEDVTRSVVAVEVDGVVEGRIRNTTLTMMNCRYPPVDHRINKIERMVVVEEDVVVVEEDVAEMARMMSPFIDREEDVMVVEVAEEDAMETMPLRHQEAVEVMVVIMRIPPEDKAVEEEVEVQFQTRAAVIMERQKVVAVTEAGVEVGAAIIIEEEEQGVDEPRRPNSVVR
jgi:hypothetical protein